MSVNINKNVSDYMARNVISVHRDEALTRALGLMDRGKLSALPVVDDAGRVCGILSTSDLIGAAYDLQCDISVLPIVSECLRKSLMDTIIEQNQDVKVSEVMTRDVETIDANTTIENAATKLTRCAVHHLPVTDTNRKPIGIISTSDIVRAVADANAASDEIQYTTHWEDDGGKADEDNFYGSPIDDEDVDANL